MRTILALTLSIIAVTAQELPKDKEAAIVFRVDQVLAGGVLGTYYDAAEYQRARKAHADRIKKAERGTQLALAKGQLEPPEPRWTKQFFFLRVSTKGLADGDLWRGWAKPDGQTYAYGSLTVKSIKAIRAAKD